MLTEAIAVVETARALGIERRGRRVLLSASPDRIPEALEALRLAIESFDRAASASTGASSPAPQPGFAAPPQIADPGLSPQQGPEGPAPDAEEAEDDIEAEAEAQAEAGRARRPTPKPREGERPAPTAFAARLAVARAAGEAADGADLGDGAFFDGDESVGDFLMALDAIDDKLRYAVTKVGWSPRLRALAEAGRIARQNMYVESVGPDGSWVRVPAEVWSTLTVAVAEAALDRDVGMPPPRAPRPRWEEPEREPEPGPRLPAPRP